jgi:hypothetical protein
MLTRHKSAGTFGGQLEAGSLASLKFGSASRAVGPAECNVCVQKSQR